ncbi:MAG: phosphatidylglycerophosphatase A [Patescibacteria group bacterium]
MNTIADGRLVSTSVKAVKDYYKRELDDDDLDGLSLKNLLELRDSAVARAVLRRKREIKAALEVTSLWPKWAMRIVSCGMHSVERSGVGTWGSFVGLMIQLIAQYFLGFGLEEMIWAAVAVSVVDLIVTRPGEECMLKFYGPRRRHTGELVSYDFNQDCLDEVAGYLWTWVGLMLLRHFGLIPDLTWWTPALAFLVFRFFDAVKPWPIKQVERAFAPGSAWGILLDDLAAAPYAAGIVGLLWRVIG